jgi:Toprim-like
MVVVDGIRLPVNVREELEAFDWDKPEWKEDRLLACSPFREDRTPSFYVYLKETETAPAGAWGDSGGQGDYRRGSFIFLLAFLRQETIEETTDYLLQKYGEEWNGEVESLSLSQRLSLDPERKRRKPLNIKTLDAFKFRHPYLEGRGVSEQVQRALKIGYDRKRRAVTIPWFTPSGELANIKYRKVDGKMFWYHRGGWPIRELVYGLDVINRKGIREAVLVEAEIDALYCMSHGIPAIAVGGAKFSDSKRDLIIRSPIQSLKVAPDNDAAGENLWREVNEKLTGWVNLSRVDVPTGYKDLNEIKDSEELKYVIKTATVKPTVFHLSLNGLNCNAKV